MKRLNNKWTTFIVPFILVVFLISCSSPEPLPLAFEGIFQPGVQNVPPVDVIVETDLPTAPQKLTAYKVLTPNVDDDYAATLAQKLGFLGEPVPIKSGDTRQVYSYNNGTDTLEINLDGSIAIRSEINFDISEKSLSDQEVIAIAQNWLTSRNMYTDIKFTTIETSPYLVTEGKVKAKEVQFNRDIAGYRIAGAGVSIIIDNDGKVVGVTAYVPQLKEYTTIATKAAEDALDILKRYLSSPDAVPPEARECIVNMRSFDRLIIVSVSIQYKINGDFAQPIYMFEGDAIDNDNPGTIEHFKGMVDAVSRANS